MFEMAADAAWWIVGFLLVSAGAVQTGPGCWYLQPPHNGVLKCQLLNHNLHCTATCLEGQVFEGGQTVIHHTCSAPHHTASTHLTPPPHLPPCLSACNSSLLEKAGSVFSASSTLLPGPTPGDTSRAPDSSVFSTPGTWRPAVDNTLQYIQVDLGSPHTIKGWRLRGDVTEGSYVRLFRLLVSVDGVQWKPYSQGRVLDKFLTGNADSVTEVTAELANPQVARFVRLNPLSWQRHIAVDWDLIGCPTAEPTTSTHTGSSVDAICPLPTPPLSGAISCERNETTVRCTAYCMNNGVFPDLNPALDLTCDPDTGAFTPTPLPACVARNKTVPPLNISGPCLQEERDCSGGVANGDYQYCSHCHYFATCSHGYFFVRPCPEQLQFDSRHGLCDYHSATCHTDQQPRQPRPVLRH